MIAPEIQNRIDGLLVADPNAVSPEVAAAALAEFNKNRAAEQQTTMVRRLNTVTNNTNLAVESLRDARRAEKKAKAFLDALADAETAYKTSGNWDAYQMATRAAETKLHSCE